MPNTNPRISVIMPVYNASNYLAEAIESITNQTFTDFELILLNDCSTDNSKDIIEHYLSKDNRILFIDKKQNVGPALLRNEGINIAKGEFIALNDSDDIALPTRFEKQLKAFENDRNLCVCGSWYTIFGEGLKDKIIKNTQEDAKLKVDFLDNCHIGNSTVMFKKALIGGNRFNPDYVPAEDYELWDRLIKTTKFHNIQESLLLYRWHSTNISQTKKENTQRALNLIKLSQLQYFGIKDTFKIDGFINATIFKRKLNPNQVIDAVKSGKTLLQNNEELKNFDVVLLQKHIEKVLIGTIRNANEYNRSFYTNLITEKWIYTKLPLIDKVILFLKCFMNFRN
jgi:glycosyltransferase involved in cell wall biosynthesis